MTGRSACCSRQRERVWSAAGLLITQVWPDRLGGGVGLHRKEESSTHIVLKNIQLTLKADQTGVL